MRRIDLFISIILFSYFHLTAQNTPTDSLELAFKNAATDTARLSMLFNEKYSKYLSQPDQAIALFQKGYELARRLGNKPAMAKMALNIGTINAYGKLDENKAFQWYQKALKISEEAHFIQGCESGYYSIGIIYDHQGFRDKMYENFLKSLAYSEQIPVPSINALRALIQCYMEAQQPEKALEIIKRGIQMIEKRGISPLNTLFVCADISDALKQMPNQEKTRDIYLKKANEILEKDTSFLFIPSTDRDLGLIALACESVGRRDLAINCAYQVLSLKSEDNIVIRGKSTVHEYLAHIYEEQKNYALSTLHYKKFMELEPKVLSQSMSEELGRKLIKAEAERDLALKQQEIERQRFYTLFAIVIIVLALILGGVSYNFYRKEQKQKAELAALNATKDRLFAILSHDLMSPVATLKNYLSLMDWGMMSQKEFAQSSERLKIKVHNLYNLLENVLHWSITQMKGIKPKIETINIQNVINEQIALLETVAKSKGIHITQAIPSDTTIQVDKNHFAIIVRNLCQNALKFTDTHGQISFSYQNTEGGKKSIQLQDTGIGMSQETLDKLFKIEQNTHRDGTAKESGTGLGLILAKELVQLNGGTINVSSEVNKGTNFTLSFPS